jgi:hypothetical protein
MRRAIGLLLVGIPIHGQDTIPNASRDGWLALLHYGPRGGGWHSDIEAPSFFLSVDGQRSPDAEWSADRVAFLADATTQLVGEHVQCRFPARFAFMKNALGWSRADIRIVDCPALAAYKDKLDAKSLSVVFVSAFLSSPASAAGHTLLYLGSKPEDRPALADYAISFEASVAGLSALQYIPRALAGGLTAKFQVAPLYQRVRAYERDQERDLWIFPVAVSQAQIDQLVLHLWELKDIPIRYGFFQSNCAQKIEELVHAVAPQYRLLPEHSLAVLPSEVARRLAERVGVEGEPIYRPSLMNQYIERVAALTPVEKSQLTEMEASRVVILGASAAALSAALLWSEFETPYKAFRGEDDDSDPDVDVAWRKSLWAARVIAGDSSTAQLSPQDAGSGESLLRSHLPTSISLSSAYIHGVGPALHFGARWLLHGALDPPIAYPPVSTIEVGRIELGMASEGKLSVDQATLIRVEKLGPGSSLQSPVAWKFEVGARRLPQQHESPLDIGMEVGVGVSTAKLTPEYSLALYSMIGARPGAALSDKGGASFLPAALWTAGLLMRVPGDLRTQIVSEYALTSRKGGTSFTWTLRKRITRNWEAESASELRPGQHSMRLGVVSFW